MHRRFWISSAAVALISVYTIAVVGAYGSFWGWGKAAIDEADPTKTHALWGQFGDFIGGLLNPLFGFLNLVAICYLAYEIHHLEGEREEANRKAADVQRTADREAEERQRTADREAEQRQRAVELLNQFMASEYYVKARLVIQQYLMPTGSRFALSVGYSDGQLRLFDFSELAVHLGNLRVGTSYRGLVVSAEDKEASYYIRAIPSFFWLVEQARNAGHIQHNETSLSHHYRWYWFHIIRFRLANCCDRRLFRRIDWLLGAENDQQAVQQEYATYLAGLDTQARNEWLALAQASQP